MNLCIGITTYNRLGSLQTLISRLRRYTSAPFDLVVGEGGGSDQTVNWCRENGVRVITGPRHSVGRTKNYPIYYFLNHSQAHYLILMEDDCRVWETGWEKEWLLTAQIWEHVNWPLTHEFGENTHTNPIRSSQFGGQCCISTRTYLSQVGYHDPRFKGFSPSHVEWTVRFRRLLSDKWGPPFYSVPCLNKHVGAEFDDSFFNADEHRAGMKLLEYLVKHEEQEPVWRDPWDSEWDKAGFIASVEAGLQVVPQSQGVAGERCPLCNGLGNLIGSKGDYKLRTCCGMILSWPWQDEETYEEWYRQPQSYHLCQQVNEGQKPYWDRDADLIRASHDRLRFLKAVRPEARTILDIGCGIGSFVSAATAIGYQVTGIEPNETIAKEALASGRNVLCGSWRDVQGTWDVITMHDVFEHLTRPQECLKKLSNHLHAGGLIVVEMPEAACRQNLADGLDWKHVRPRQHICLYSDAAAISMFKSCHLEVEMMYRPLMGTLGKIAYFIRNEDSDRNVVR